MARSFLFSGAILLTITAVFHLTGWSDVSGWLEGDQGKIVSLLWLMPAVTWLIVAAIWLHAGLRSQPWTAATTMLSFIPLLNGALLLIMVSPLHPGGYMLVASSILAFLGARKPN